MLEAASRLVQLVAAAFILAILMDLSPFLKASISLVVLLTQTMPTIAPF
ncbi:MAG: hypothetical protein LBP88_04205 [Treponema sp.]|nr:hypothetical protein [Treponema sp.]